MMNSISEPNDNQTKKKMLTQHRQNELIYPLRMLPPIYPLSIHILLRMRCVGREEGRRQREKVRGEKKKQTRM